MTALLKGTTRCVGSAHPHPGQRPGTAHVYRRGEGHRAGVLHRHDPMGEQAHAAGGAFVRPRWRNGSNDCELSPRGTGIISAAGSPWRGGNGSSRRMTYGGHPSQRPGVAGSLRAPAVPVGQWRSRGIDQLPAARRHRGLARRQRVWAPTDDGHSRACRASRASGGFRGSHGADAAAHRGALTRCGRTASDRRAHGGRVRRRPQPCRAAVQQ